MIIKNLEHESLRKYFEFAERMGELLLTHLNNWLVFKQKLDILEVTVNISHGNTEAFFITKNSKYSLLLVVNPKDDERLIKFIIAHDLAHLLFAPVNKLNLSGYCATDESFDVTSIKRISNGVEEYGNILEELVCDYIALKVLMIDYYPFEYDELLDIVFSKKRDFRFFKENLYLIEEIISKFGVLPEISPSFKFDNYIENKTGAQPVNFFMYAAITGIMNLFVNEYDSLMGMGAWKKFNQNLESFVLDNTNIEAKKIIDIEMKRYSMM